MRLFSVLKYAGLLTFGYILLLSLSYPYGPIGYPVFILVIGACILWIKKKSNIIDNKDNTKRIFLVLLFIGGAIRFLWAIQVPTLPVSDFQYFHESALKLSQGTSTLTKNMGYTLLLSFGYYIYPGVITGKIINAMASTLSFSLLYLIGSKLINPRTGLIAAFLFAILPSEVNMVSVLGTEVTATTMGLITVFFLSLIKNSNLNSSTIWIFCAGLFYGLGLSVRFSLLFYFPVIVLFIFFFTFPNIRQKVKVFSIFLVGITTGLCLIVMSYSLIAGHISIEPLRTQDSITFLTGTNIATSGKWNQDDDSLYFSWPVGERDKIARQEALERITSKPIEFLLLIPKKFAILMGPNDYGNLWSLYAIDWGDGNLRGIRATSESSWKRYRNLRNELIIINGLLSQTIYIVIWFFAFYAFMNLKNNSIYNSISLIVLTLVIFTLLPHIVLEVQGRYHHYVMPFIALLAACGIKQIGETRQIYSEMKL